MTQTPNIGLKKIDGSENWRQIFDYHNDSMDKADSSVAAVQDGLAIVANGNTHASVAEGQFVYVRNHSTLAEGLYKATDAIATNGELTTSNLTADGSGGLNDLQGQVDALNSKFAWKQIANMSATTSVTLPTSDWSELCVIINIGTSMQAFDFSLAGLGRAVSLHRGFVDNSSSLCKITISDQNIIQCETLTWYGSDRLSDCTMTVYYR